MKINGRNVLIFPEYHLTDFPPQAAFTRQEARDILAAYKNQGYDLLISGYVERENDRRFSACIVIDGMATHNIRKGHPFLDETRFISPATETGNLIELSIGLTLLIICHDYAFLLEGEYQRLVEANNIENLILISAMFRNFDENTERCIDYCRTNDIKKFISSDRFFGFNVTEVN